MKNLLLFTVVVILTSVQIVKGQIPVTSDTIIANLEPGKSIEREMNMGEIHIYHITLFAGQFLHAVVEQRGIDVVLTLFDPGGNKICENDSPNGSHGPESVEIEINTSGTFCLEVKSLEGSGEEGHYEVRIEDILSAKEYADRLEQERANYEIVKNWIAENAISFTTVESGSGFEDLQPLRKLIGDSHLVALGEATHGTREFFQFKHRMLEFLVEEMGFTVFGIEASMPEAFDINEYILTGKGDPAKALAGLYFWTWNTEEVLDMIHWMRQYNEDINHKQKIKFYGFDMQKTPRAFKGTIEYLYNVDSKLAIRVKDVLGILGDPFIESDFRKLSHERKEQIVVFTDSIMKLFDENRLEYIERSNDTEWALARQYVAIIVQNLRMRTASPRLAVRDSAMAENIRWILEQEGENARMVAWAHNGHLMELFISAGSMGWHLRNTFDSDMVNIGFAFNQGSFQAVEMQPAILVPLTVNYTPRSFLGFAFHNK